MSENDSSTNSDNPLADLSALNFGPAWAKEKPQKRSKDSGNSRNEKFENSDNRRSGRKAFAGGRDRDGGNRRRSGGGRGSQNFRGRGERRERFQKVMVPAPEGVTARIMPIEEGLDALAKDIAATGRTHSVFDIAWLVLGGLDRFYIIFESEESVFYKNKNDHSLWMSPQECMAHFWNANIVKKYYQEETVDVDPPKGNFQSVARCGLSGELIGPPNHHAYQKTILDLHRSKFSNMPLERYKSKIVMEHGEEAVQAWMDSMSKQLRWSPLAKEEAVLDPAPKEDVEEKEKKQEEELEVPVEEKGEEGSVASEENVELTEKSTEEVKEAEEVNETNPQIVLNSRQEVEKHFETHGFKDEFESGKVMSVLANVPAKMINPGLLTLLKETVREERRYPGKLASFLCRQLSGRHLAVFKWRKHLHCGPARPRKVSEDVKMAERPNKLYHWVLENPGGEIEAMWKAVFPEDIDDETRHLWYHDLHWLINEGIVLLFSNGKLHAAKELDAKPQPPKKEEKKSEKTVKEKSDKKSEEEPKEEPKEKSKEEPKTKEETKEDSKEEPKKES